MSGDDVAEAQAYRALDYPAFRWYAVGGLLSNIGLQMMGLAVSWQIYSLTHSAAALGLVGLVEVVPIVGLMLPGGHVADHYSRKRLVLLANLVTAACALVLALWSLGSLALPSWGALDGACRLLERFSHGLGERTTAIRSPLVPMMYGLLALLGVVRAFGGPARAALLPALVPPEAFSNAVAWNSSFFQLSAVLGPALGGLLVARLAATPFHFAGVHFVAAGSALIMFVCVLRVPDRAVETSREPVTLESLLAGIQFVRRQRIILATITLDLFAVLLGGAVALLPIYADQILHVGPRGLGVLRAAPSVGALLMALAIANRPPLKRAGPALLWSVAGFGLATIVFGVSRSFWLSLAMLFLTGALDNISVVVRHTLVQTLTPDAMRGRVSAVNQVFISLSNELGGLESGLVAAACGPVLSVVAGGVGTILVVLAVMGIWPEVGRLRSLTGD